MLDPETIPKQQLAMHASDDMLLFTAVIAVVIGCALIWMGRRGRIMWLRVWGAGLIVMSIYMGLSVALQT